MVFFFAIFALFCLQPMVCEFRDFFHIKVYVYYLNPPTTLYRGETKFGLVLVLFPTIFALFWPLLSMALRAHMPKNRNEFNKSAQKNYHMKLAKASFEAEFNYVHHAEHSVGTKGPCSFHMRPSTCLLNFTCSLLACHLPAGTDHTWKKFLTFLEPSLTQEYFLWKCVIFDIYNIATSSMKS